MTGFIQILYCISLDVTTINPEWLAVYVPNMCTFSKPLNDPPPSYDDTTGTVKCHMSATFGECVGMCACAFCAFINVHT